MEILKTVDNLDKTKKYLSDKVKQNDEFADIFKDFLEADDFDDIFLVVKDNCIIGVFDRYLNEECTMIETFGIDEKFKREFFETLKKENLEFKNTVLVVEDEMDLTQLGYTKCILKSSFTDKTYVPVYDETYYVKNEKDKFALRKHVEDIIHPIFNKNDLSFVKMGNDKLLKFIEESDEDVIFGYPVYMDEDKLTFIAGFETFKKPFIGQSNNNFLLCLLDNIIIGVIKYTEEFNYNNQSLYLEVKYVDINHFFKNKKIALSLIKELDAHLDGTLPLVLSEQLSNQAKIIKYFRKFVKKTKIYTYNEIDKVLGKVEGTNMQDNDFLNENNENIEEEVAEDLIIEDDDGEEEFVLNETIIQDNADETDTTPDETEPVEDTEVADDVEEEVAKEDDVEETDTLEDDEIEDGIIPLDSEGNEIVVETSEDLAVEENTEDSENVSETVEESETLADVEEAVEENVEETVIEMVSPVTIVEDKEVETKDIQVSEETEALADETLPEEEIETVQEELEIAEETEIEENSEEVVEDDEINEVSDDETQDTEIDKAPEVEESVLDDEVEETQEPETSPDVDNEDDAEEVVNEETVEEENVAEEISKPNVVENVENNEEVSETMEGVKMEEVQTLESVLNEEEGEITEELEINDEAEKEMQDNTDESCGSCCGNCDCHLTEDDFYDNDFENECECDFIEKHKDTIKIVGCVLSVIGALVIISKILKWLFKD